MVPRNQNEITIIYIAKALGFLIPCQDEKTVYVSALVIVKLFSAALLYSRVKKKGMYSSLNAAVTQL